VKFVIVNVFVYDTTTPISIFLQGAGSMKYNFMVSIIKSDDWYVASCLENHIASQGKSREEALEYRIKLRSRTSTIKAEYIYN